MIAQLFMCAPLLGCVGIGSGNTTEEHLLSVSDSSVLTTTPAIIGICQGFCRRPQTCSMMSLSTAVKRSFVSVVICPNRVTDCSCLNDSFLWVMGLSFAARQLKLLHKYLFNFKSMASSPERKVRLTVNTCQSFMQQNLEVSFPSIQLQK